MALVTVQRSPTPSNSPELCDECGSVSDICQCSSGTATPCSQRACRTPLRQRSLSECYFAVKGAAVILPQTECLAMPRQSNSAGGDIQLHLHAMLNLLRPQDTLKMAVRLESLLGKHTRYMAIVSAIGRQDTQESVILGIDYVGPQEITIGLMLPIWASTRIALDGDGGICVESNGCHHIFKPVSVQAMWSVFQSLHKEHGVATRYPYFPGGLSHTWTQYYESRICSSEAFRSEWHYTYQDDSDLKADSLDRFKEKPPERAAAEKLIRMTLKDIMQSVDLDEVTSKDIRTKLEDKLEMNLVEYKEFIDEEMLVILGQMDKPSQIFSYLYLGSEWNASNYDELKQNRVGYILNVTKEVDNFFPGLFSYMKVPVSDEESTELLKYWDATYKYILQAKEKDSAVLVHCKKGISRSSSTVIAFLMKAYEWSVEEALKYVKEKRNCITPNKGFMEQLRTYQGILDASKNRNSVLFNPLKTTPSEPDLVPWEGLCDEDEMKRPGNDILAIVYSKKVENASAVTGLLVASENILKSGPSSEHAFPTACEDTMASEGAQLDENRPMEVGQETPIPQAAVHRWITPPVTGIVCTLTSKFEGASRHGSGEYAQLVESPADTQPQKDSDIMELDGPSLKEELLPDVSSRLPLRRQLLNVEERMRDQPMTLRSVQEMLMRRGSHSPTSSDSCSLSSGDESDPCLAKAKHRRNSKSSSGDSAVADLARFPSGVDWAIDGHASSGERQGLAQSCPNDSFAFAAGRDADSSFGLMTRSAAAGDQPVVPPGQVRRVTLQYERGMRAANSRRSSPALMELEKEAGERNTAIDQPAPIDNVERPRTARSNSATSSLPSKKLGMKFLGRIFSTRKDQGNSDSHNGDARCGASLLKAGQTTWYDGLRKRATATCGASAAATGKSRAKSDGCKIWITAGKEQRNGETCDPVTSPTKVLLKVAEPGKVRTRKEKFEGRNGPRVNSVAGAYAPLGIGAASIWMATSHEGCVKRITNNLESKYSTTRSHQRGSFDGGKSSDENSRLVRSIAGNFEPTLGSSPPAPLPIVKSSSGHATYPLGPPYRKRATAYWMRHGGSWFDLQADSDARDDRLDDSLSLTKRIPVTDPFARSRSLTRRDAAPSGRRCASARMEDA